MKGKKMILLTGGIIGLLSVLLVYFGNPGNMGVCVACFIRDTAGALGLHSAANVQYIRPEIIGFILGSFLIAVITKEFRPTGGSSPLIRFIMGVFVMFGALVFLGCPLRMILRLAAGDLNALVGLVGFAVGILIGTIFLKKGFTLGRSQKQSKTNGFIAPAIAVVLLVFLVLKPAFVLFSQEGPGSMAAPILFALAAGLIVGILGQRSRMCMAGGFRDIYLIKDFKLISGFAAIFVVALILNFAFGFFKFGFAEQPIAHTDGIWNFLGMVLVGLGSCLLGGCPLRQTILAGEGNTDSAVTFLGLLVGGALSHNFGIAASPTGVPVNGQVAVVVGLVVLVVIACLNIYFNKKKQAN